MVGCDVMNASNAADRWRHVTDIAHRQHGVVGQAQLVDLGVTPRQRRRMVDTGRLVKTAPRVWRISGAPVTWEHRLHRGLLSLGPRSWVSDEAAAQLHGLDRTPSDRVEFVVWRPGRDASLDDTVHSTRRWTASDGVVIDGLRVTSATRTVFDLANRRASDDRLAAAIDSAIRLELSSPEAIRRRLRTIRGRGMTGVRIVERLLEHAGVHSMLERRFLHIVEAARLPTPELQVTFRSPTGDHFIARVDFYFRSWDLVVEVSGKLGHSSPEERSRDAQRRNELQELGVRVLEFTWEDVTQRPAYVIGQLRRLLDAA